MRDWDTSNAPLAKPYRSGFRPWKSRLWPVRAEGSKKMDDPPVVREVTGFARWSAAGLGLAGLSLGATAVFVSENQAGTVALLVVGLSLLFVALAGVLPLRMKWGDKEIDFGILGSLLQDAVADASDDDRTQMAAYVASGSGSTQSPARTVLSEALSSALHYEKSVASAVPADARIDLAGARDEGIDFIVSRPNGRRIGVHVKAYARPLPVVVVREIAALRDHQRRRGLVDELLLVSATESTLAARAAINETGLPIVVAPDPDLNPGLVSAAISDLLDSATP